MQAGPEPALSNLWQPTTSRARARVGIATAFNNRSTLAAQSSWKLEKSAAKDKPEAKQHGS
ncbi:hypothetical protein M378DRAFT_11121 [Amanita muscaria Koide BX008]|uniref:Uncharacterized protein n=1 Tax=Amanita muscaria (strain Koide BX008) TaxID=946122 RepID=A0A0C2TDZ1_AMAMK|nr:hypothetical protein M378DRAFT_11121 [Amanita muscaria Koide BX008]